MDKRMFGIIGKKAKYPALSWGENFMGGHINIGRITIYGANAMNWAVNIKTKRWGYICFTIPLLRRKHHYFYLSPNATPWACTYYSGYDTNEKIRAEIRKLNFGHGFDSSDSETYKKLRCLNEKFERFIISDYDMESVSGEK